MLEAVFRNWYAPTLHPFNYALLPASWLFRCVVHLRRRLYALNILQIKHVPVPVIVVGNITVGGTGKTPFVIWLAQWLKELGYRPGIVSRGVGGIKHAIPYRVRPNDSAEKVGDEAILLTKKTNCPVIVCVDRARAVHEIISVNCNIVISDDGLQHYRMGRDIEIAMVDGVRRLGNQCLLPAGPLREPKSRLSEVDFMIVNGGMDAEFNMELLPSALVSLKNPSVNKDFSYFLQKKVHAVAAIGHPQRFFNLLKKLGFDILPHVFPDHHLYTVDDFNFKENLPIIMTEKDAVKCAAFADERYWYLPINAKISDNFPQKLRSRLGHL